jgi:hypothetical protein
MLKQGWNLLDDPRFRKRPCTELKEPTFVDMAFSSISFI